MIFNNVDKFSREKSIFFLISGFLLSFLFSLSGLSLVYFFNNSNPLRFLSGMALFVLFGYFAYFYYKCLKIKIN
ncbi:hypothetical protein ACQ4W7_28675 [Janthinobacterium sp. MDT1-19]